ncbi:MAG: argininosuccinate lyase, partial [Propionibacteriaceae bacterium]|nr:argininosuccinate lyase [Propionibacteriaceae bacterium]
MTEGVLWGGRFTSAPAQVMFALSQSTQFDFRLAKLDLRGSIAHAHALRQAGLLSSAECDRIVAGLTQLIDMVESGQFVPAPSDEDVHGALERGLTELLGPELAGRLRAGRSRNDQIATLIRMYLREQSLGLQSGLLGLIDALRDQA